MLENIKKLAPLIITAIIVALSVLIMHFDNVNLPDEKNYFGVGGYQTVTATSSADGDFYKSGPTINLSTSTTMALNLCQLVNNCRRMIFKFPLTQYTLGSSYVASSSIDLYYFGYFADASNTAPIIACKASSTHQFTEGNYPNGVTWNKYDGVNNWTTGGGDLDTRIPACATTTVADKATAHWMRWDVTDQVKYALNQGETSVSFLVRFNPEEMGSGGSVPLFYAHEYATDAYRPRININYLANPGINTFAASSSRMVLGSSTNITYNVMFSTSTKNAIHVYGSGYDSWLTATSGDIFITPIATGNQTYTIEAGDGNGTTTTSTIINVVSTPVVDSFTAPNYILPPTITEALTWSVFGAWSVSIDQGVGTVASTGTANANASPGANTYTITATNGNGTTQATVSGYRYASSTTFSYTGAMRSWTPLASVNKILIIAKSASGHSSGYNVGGGGGVATGTLEVSSANTYYISIGQQGGAPASGQGGVGGYSQPYPKGAGMGFSATAGNNGGGGGGMTWITNNNYLATTSATTSIYLVLGGGGGSGGGSQGGYGGDGGIIGSNGANSTTTGQTCTGELGFSGTNGGAKGAHAILSGVNWGGGQGYNGGGVGGGGGGQGVMGGGGGGAIGSGSCTGAGGGGGSGYYNSSLFTNFEYTDGVNKAADGSMTIYFSTTTDYITGNDFSEFKVYQRTSTSTGTAMPFSGTYTGTQPSGIEVRILDRLTNAIYLDWSDIGAVIGGGIWYGTTTVPTNNTWYRFQVRTTNNHDEYWNSFKDWTMGDVYSIGGQSNMAYMFFPYPTAPTLVATATVSTWGAKAAVCAACSCFDDLDAQWHPPLGQGAIALGNRYVQYSNVPVGLMNFAFGGLALLPATTTATCNGGYSNWANFNHNGNPSVYWNMVASSTKQQPNGVAGFMFIQGEAEAQYPTYTKAQYLDGLDQLLSNIRNELKYAFSTSGTGTIPFFEGQISGCDKTTSCCGVAQPDGTYGTDVAWQTIRDAQRDWSDANINNEVYWAANTIDLTYPDCIHHNNAGWTQEGYRFAQAALFKLGYVNYYRGPSLTANKLLNGSQIRVTITHRNGTDFLPTSGITGFEIPGATISSVVRESANTIIITVSGSLPGNTTVRYLYGRSPVITAPAYDNTDLALPLEENSDVPVAQVYNINLFKGQVYFRQNIKIKAVN